MRTRTRALVGLVALVAASCANVLGLGDYSDGTNGGGADVGTDAVPGAGSDAGAVDSGSAVLGVDGCATCFVVPAGWSIVAFADSAQTTCPSGFGQSPLDLVGLPSAAGDACTCDGCTVTTPPSCVTGAIGVSFDANGTKTCTQPFNSLANANPGGCNTDNFHGQVTAGYDVKFTPPPPTGGTCAAGAPIAHDDRVTVGEHARSCAPDSAAAAGCSGGVCSLPSVPAPFAACLSHAGNVSCPDGSFSVAHHVGSEAELACSATCACTTGATCTGATVTYYADGTCGGPAPLVTPATGACVNQGGKNGTYGSYKYAATTNATCTATGTSDAHTTLSGEMTICCPP
jgi:hypothetical protein